MENDLLGAVKAGDLARVKQAISGNPVRAASLDDNGVSALLTAVYYGHREIAALLASTVSTMSMHEGADIGDLATIRALGRWPDTLRDYSPDGWTPLHLAAAFGGADAVRALLDLGADPNQRSQNALDNTPLHACVAISHSDEIVRMLLDAGADINATQHGGFTPLHSAAFNGSTDVVRLLLERGADRHLKTDDDQTAADLAREKGHQQIISMLAT
jgi:ankyrin repeat protein